MTPIPQEHPEGMEQEAPHADAVVISGVSALMPRCQNLLEFSEKLYNKEQLTQNDQPRWKNIQHPELPQYTGRVDGISQFDAQHFIVHNGLAHSSDAASRKLLEHSFQAIFDAGVNPSDLWGKRVGVFISAGISESDTQVIYKNTMNYGLLGCNRAMFSNRISYYLNLKGPSITMDASCCGSLAVLEAGLNAIRTGLCDAAIVGSAAFLLLPQTVIMYRRIVPLSEDGKTKSYDSQADGQVRSEAASIVLLQKYKDAKRVYAQLCHAKTGFVVDKFGERRELQQNIGTLTRFLGEFYQEAGVHPNLVEYVDGFGAAIPEVDKVELDAMGEVFCKGRSDPLLVGSVMSNIGYTENASGLCSIMKLILAYQKGEVAASLNCKNPRNDVAAIREGSLQIVVDNHTFTKTYAAINSFALTGLNGHALLKGLFKPKVPSKYKCDLPYLVIASGRQESSVEKILQDVGSREIDPEEMALLYNFFKARISQHLARGFGIYSTKANKTVVERESVDYYDETKKPLWFVYSGMGSQWAGMGIDLMSIPTFAAAVQRCHKVLLAKGIDLIGIITTPDEKIFDNILNSFVGIAAIQIGLTTVLKEIGLLPDNIIGHSVGELGCAYADGCFTAEEVILMAYYRGLVSIETKFIHGAMAAVGLGYKEISKMCPSEIEVACRNGPSSCTISGPADIVTKFVTTLTARGIFAKEVKCSNIAYHSRYIAEAGPKLLKKMSEFLKEPKLRSKRWISTSVPQSNWNEPSALYSSAEYHTNNLLNPVLFEDGLNFVPHNAVLVEIAPYGLLQAILKRSLSSDCKLITLTRKDDAHNIVNVLEAIGKLYMEGFDMNLSALYPKIEFPVSTGTRPMSHLIQWAHTETWSTCHYVGLEKRYNAVYKQVISIHDDDYSYLAGHSIEGVKVYPFAAALVAVWDTMAMINNKKRQVESVVFQDVWFYTQPPLYDHCSRHVMVQLHRGSGYFEVTYENGIIADGYIKVAVKASSTTETHKWDINSTDLTSHEIYKIFSERGYGYRDHFQSILKANVSLTQANLKWRNNWACLLDGILQLHALRTPYEGITLPNSIKDITIDFKKHQLEILDMNESIEATYDELQNITRCGGVSIKNVRCRNMPLVAKQSMLLTTLKFVPHIQNNVQDMIMTLYIYVKIISENLNKNNLKILNIYQNNKNCLFDDIMHLLKNEVEINVTSIRQEEFDGSKPIDGKPDVIFMNHLMLDKHSFVTLFNSLPPNIFVINHGEKTNNIYPSSSYSLLCSAGKENEKMELACWRINPSTPVITALTVQSKSDLYHLETVHKNMSQYQKLLILAPNSLFYDLKTLVQKWRENQKCNNISVAIMDKKNFDEQKITDLINLDFVFNVLKDGVWGGEYYIPTVTKGISIDNVALKLMHPEEMTSLNWVQVPEARGGVTVTVHYAGLNVNDVKRTAAEISGNYNEQGFGMDFSGVSESGERVMGIIKSGAASRRVSAHHKLLWPVPKHWTLEDAATVPLAYAHAFYCLAIKTKLYPGMKVLIHGGAGALGQAAIAIALEYKCQVFTTVSDVRKKHFLRKLFPDLKENHIGSSRDETFGDMVMFLTKQTGCDIIISCVRGRLKNTTLKCCTSDGVTIDTVQLTDSEKYTYGMYYLDPCRSYHIVDFSSVLFNENYEEMAKLQLLVSEGIARGYVKPLSRVVYTASDATRAFKLLASSNHRGRVLLQLRHSPQAESRIQCMPEFRQLIVSDKEDFAIQLADRLIKRGAKNIHINCFNPTNYLSYKKCSWEKLGVEVKISSVKLDEIKKVHTFFSNIANVCNMESIFVSGVGVPGDEISTMLVNLDLFSRKMCRNLRFFTFINNDIIGQDVILNRSKHGLPSLMLFLHNLEKFTAKENDNVINDEGKNPNNFQGRIVLNAIEKALYSDDAIIHAHVRPLSDKLLIEDITKICGTKVSSIAIYDTKLEDIGVDNNEAKEICNMLKDKFNIVIFEEILLSMTIQDLQALKEEPVKEDPDVDGFNSYFNNIDTDEMNATADFILMRTLINSETGSEELDKNLNYLCIVPGLEGHYGRFDTLCETLKIPTVVLQPGIEESNETVHEIAERMIEVITKKLTVKKHFYLVGYEFGIMIVLEMAAILESRGYTASVYLLGGTPKDMQECLEMRLNAVNGEWQDTLILHMFFLISGTESRELAKLLLETAIWEEKVEICLKILRSNVSHTSEYLRKQIDAAYKRITMMRYWTMKLKPIMSKIVIVRAMMQNIIADEELIQFPNADVYNIPASLAKTPQDLRCAAIINRTLSSEILDDFKNKNQCEINIIDDAVLKLKDDEN